ncbi:MAG: helix-hairpin-helix domain-containing protein, partial [Faecalibacterium sp.]|nr:helix-hairpin-helix domain-containing protein [Faecalibacterium sp.]
MNPEDSEILTGFVEDVVFRNNENGYTVLDVSCDGKLITAVGMLSSVSVGEELKMTGEWKVHHVFGSQFKVNAFERRLPKTAADMLRYLSSGTVKGIGPATAMKIVDKFGDETFDVIENTPHLLAEIKGITADKAEKIGSEFKKQFAVREVMIYLEKYGMTATECLAAYKAFGANAIERISENPYILCREKIGISFARADEIADAFTSVSNPIYRERAGIVHIIKHNLGNGHTCLPREKIILPACELLGCSEQEANKVIDDLIEDKE